MTAKKTNNKKITMDIVDKSDLGKAGSIYMTGHGIPGSTPAGSDPQQLRTLDSSGRFVQAAVTLVNASCSGTTATITTSVAHQITVGQKVFVMGVNVADYNGVFQVSAVGTDSFAYSVSKQLDNGSGGAVYLPTLLSSQTITAATSTAANTVTITLSGQANIPLNSPVYISSLSGKGKDWNGVQIVLQNSASNPALSTNQFQFQVNGASGTAKVTGGPTVEIVALNPVALTALPTTGGSGNPHISLNSSIEGYSAQLVAVVTPASEAPYPLGITPGTANLTNLGNPPFAVGQQAGNAVADIIEFYYAGSKHDSTFDLSQVDGVALPLTLKASTVTAGPDQVGLDSSLSGLSRQAIGSAYSAFIAKEPSDVQSTGKFGRLLYDSAVGIDPLTVAPASQTGTALTDVSLKAQPSNSTLILATTSIPHKLVPGQAIEVTGANSPYNGNFKVLATKLTDNSLSNTEFTYTAGSIPGSSATGTVTPTEAGVIATSVANLVVQVTQGSPQAPGTSVELIGVSANAFNSLYTVLGVPAGVDMPAESVYLATTTGQTFTPGQSSGGGTLSKPIFQQPPSVPGGQFYVIAAPKDWLANQPVSSANKDAMASWWDKSIDTFFAAGNYLQVAIGTAASYTGVYNPGSQAFDFYSGLQTSGKKAFSIAKPSPVNGQNQSLANATWVWGQAGIPSNDEGTVWDQIVQAFCRGVIMDGVLTSKPDSMGQSNAAWVDTAKWYTEHTSANFPDFTSVYCPFSKFAHYSTLGGDTDRSGKKSINTANLAYGFSEDEVPIGADGKAIATGVPSKMDGTVENGSTLTLTVNPWT